MRNLLGVDGGNSKTDVIIADDMGQLRARVRGPGCSPDALGVSGFIDVLGPLVAAARRQAGLHVHETIDAASLLIAGVDRPEQEQMVTRALEPLKLGRQLVVSNDTFAVLLAGSTHGHGVAVVCGAGLNAVGVTPDGKVGRYQALGELSGDWGGGYAVGLAALGAAIRGDDGRGTRTVLTALLCQRFAVDSPQAVAAAIHEGRLDSQALVDLSPLVFDAADNGDDVSCTIVDRVGDEVAAMAVAMLRRLRLTEGDTEVVLGGGLLQAGNSRLDARIQRLVHDAVSAAVLRVLDVPPVLGCARAALAKLDTPEREIAEALRVLRKNLAVVA